jgi:AbrB family looped-hinge helix DNA binding protein
MDESVVTAKGQVVIPSKLRRKFGIKKGTQIYLYEREGEIIVRPVTDEYLRGLPGLTRTKGKLLKALMKEKRSENSHGWKAK